MTAAGITLPGCLDLLLSRTPVPTAASRFMCRQTADWTSRAFERRRIELCRRRRSADSHASSRPCENNAAPRSPCLRISRFGFRIPPLLRQRLQHDLEMHGQVVPWIWMIGIIQFVRVLRDIDPARVSSRHSSPRLPAHWLDARMRPTPACRRISSTVSYTPLQFAFWSSLNR